MFAIGYYTSVSFKRQKPELRLTTETYSTEAAAEKAAKDWVHANPRKTYIVFKLSELYTYAMPDPVKVVAVKKEG